MDETWKTVLLVTAGLFGAAVGSFLNVCIYRLPRKGLTVSRPRRSFCPSCGTGITWRDNLPIVSWIALGAQCRACRAPIPARYVIVESLTAALFLLIAWRCLVLERGTPAAALVLAALGAGLIVASLVDLELRILPDQITLRGMMVAPFVVLAVPEILSPDRLVRDAVTRFQELVGPTGTTVPAVLHQGPGLWASVAVAAALCASAGSWAYLFLDRAPRPHGESRIEGGILSAIVAGAIGGMLALNVLRPGTLSEPRVQAFWASEFGMGVGAGLVWLVGWLGSRVFRKEAMGFGDVKLMGLLGAVVGWTGVLRGFFVACLLGSVIGVFVLVRHRSHYVPFGPFLSVGCYSLLLWPEAFESAVRWYLGLFGAVPG